MIPWVCSERGNNMNTENTNTVENTNEQPKRILVDLSDATLASIDAASEKFAAFGLTKTKARQLVAAKIAALSAEVSAVELFADEVRATLGQ